MGCSQSSEEDPNIKHSIDTHTPRYKWVFSDMRFRIRIVRKNIESVEENVR